MCVSKISKSGYYVLSVLLLGAMMVNTNLASASNREDGRKVSSESQYNGGVEEKVTPSYWRRIQEVLDADYHDTGTPDPTSGVF